jgi:4-amino-4-deoxy-L-arabinose transferase-like glycosyltransferase
VFVSFVGTLALILFNLSAGAWLSDESYYMVAGQGYTQFLLRPNQEEFARLVLNYLHTPSQEAAGLVNHPFLGKLVIGVFLLTSGSNVPSNLCCPPLMPTPMQLFWARLPSTLAAASAICIVFYLISSRFGLISATLGSVFLLSDATFLQYSRWAMLDVYAATFLTAAVALIVISSSLGRKQLCLLGLLGGLMLVSKFALGVFLSFLLVLCIVFQRRGWKGLVVCLATSLGLFFLVDFYYFFLPPPYLLDAFLAAGRPIPEGIGITQGPLAPFLAMFSWEAYYSIPHTWSLVEVTLVALSLALGGFLRIKRKHDDSGIDIFFLANATLGFASFVWERPLVLLAPLSALFVATTISKFSREYVPKRAIPMFQVGAIVALLVQLATVAPQAYFSNSPFQYQASTYIPAMFHLHPLEFSGEIVLAFLILFAVSLAVSLLRRKNSSGSIRQACRS